MPCPYARLIVGTRHCRVLTLGNINSDATGIDMNFLVEQASCLLLTMVHSGIEFKEQIPKPVTSNIPRLKYKKV